MTNAVSHRRHVSASVGCKLVSEGLDTPTQAHSGVGVGLGYILLIAAAEMHRRAARLRREYLYRKSLEGKQREEYEKKRTIRQALQEGKPIPTHLRVESAKLKRDVDLEDDNTAVQRNNVDDEYSNLGVLDPKVIVH